jgi:hypothetical protein
MLNKISQMLGQRLHVFLNMWKVNGEQWRGESTKDTLLTHT